MIKKIIIMLTGGLFAYGCATVPLSGRRQLSLVDNAEILPLSYEQYREVKKESKIVTNSPDGQKVVRVGNRIAAAVEQYLKENNYGNLLEGFSWEFNLIEDDQVNAWCMPGGKIVFYTGILPICQGETGIAVVMGHEIAHALVNHGAQRMSASALQQYVGLAGNVALGVGGSSSQTISIFNQAYGIGSQVVVMLPFSRSHETEADAIGLRLMAIAGYDPTEAARLWQRMSAQ